MSLFDWLFGCDHIWISFTHSSHLITYSNGNDLNFIMKPKFCNKCKAVEWEQVK